ncbi:hypothetical protein PsexTeo8_62380 (plasmid) [Pseudomonas extremaustralis]|nr:hypothetical protein [Pseudomonas extremaustralis]
MRVEQHLVTLARISHQPEGTARAQLQVRHLHAPVNAADQQAFLAPVKLKRLAKGKGQRHKGVRCLALIPAPGTDKRGELAVATVITLGFDLCQQRLGTAPLLLGTQRVGFKRLLQRAVKRTQLVENGPAQVHRLLGFRRSDPLANGVARQSGALGYLMQRQLVAEIHPPNFAHHFHTDHPVFSCS